MKKATILCLFIFSVACLCAQEFDQLWLRNTKTRPLTVNVTKASPMVAIAKQELQQGWQGDEGASIALTIVKDKAIKTGGFRLTKNGVEATTEAGLLYGVYDLLRRQATGQSTMVAVNNPSYQLRVLNHWDNLNGSIERGYAGGSIFWRRNDPFTVTEKDKSRWLAYARANASVGINGSVLNNVNASPQMLTAEYIKRVKAIADVLRPYGITVYLSVNFSSPAVLGKLKNSDPLEPAVQKWWKDKAKEIYSLVPDFGGFLVKANSEGQPGPQDFGRTHVDGANMLADAVKPYKGVVMWRAFVYSPNDKDRAKLAYQEFMPFDGQFRDNVIIQVKNGPIDFQPREPFSPLIGAMKKTSVMAEFQVTQEYLGHSTHLVFLSPMWEECLQSDTYQQGRGSTVAKCTDGSIYPQQYTAIAGVSNVGLDSNWTGHHFAQANWYAFGRLAWKNDLKSEQIADEWLKQTYASTNGNEKDWEKNFLKPTKQMLLDSREAAVNYMMPLGLHHIMSANGHYGPGPWWQPKGMRAEWTPPYYHQATTNGVGFDRTKTGSDAVSQYAEPLASQYNNPATCPEELLLWFHHLPWNHKLKNGRSLWDEMAYRYDKGVQQVRGFQMVWDRAEPYIDSLRFTAVQQKLRAQALNSVVWKDAVLQFFQQYSRMPIPYDIERPVNNLDDIRAREFPDKESANRSQ
ncbi:MAG TPA: alpha-glucuronidase [Flavisolibacter sp.]|nr:alpha-glucuronidase [Flavisolibacter sp.]